MHFRIFLLQLLFSLVSGHCSDKSNCFSCVRSQEKCPWCYACEWCPVTDKCQYVGDSTCPRGISQGKSHCKDEFTPTKPYNETIARYLIDVAFSAYVENPQRCLDNVQVKHTIKSQCDERGGVCFAFVGVDPTQRAIILSFRGTQTKVQLIMEGVYLLKEYEVHGKVGGVMKYFKEAFDVLWPCLFPTIKDLHTQHPDYEIWVTGHSLGGSLASVAAFELAQERLWSKDKLKLVTYGQPRTGNFHYAIEHDHMVPYSWRIVNNRDAIPHIPVCGGFHGHCLMSNTQPYHHGREVWYNNGMGPGAKYKECKGVPHNEDLECSSGLYIKLSATDHLYYFEKSQRGFCPSQLRNKYERLFSGTCQIDK